MHVRASLAGQPCRVPLRASPVLTAVHNCRLLLRRLLSSTSFCTCLCEPAMMPRCRCKTCLLPIASLCLLPSLRRDDVCHKTATSSRSVALSQAELREFAWTEGELAGKQAQLAKSAHGIDAEQTTVFCFQTAVQAVLWSKVAYTFLCALSALCHQRLLLRSHCLPNPSPHAIPHVVAFACWTHTPVL